MIRKSDRLLKFCFRIIDVLLVVGAFYGAYYLHVGIITPLFYFIFTGLYPIDFYYWILSFTLPLCFILLHLSGFYKDPGLEPQKKFFGRIFKAGFFLTLTEYIIIYVLLKMEYVSRFFIFLFMAIYLVLLIGFRFSVIHLFYRVRKRSLNDHRVLIIGTGRPAKEVSEEIASHPLWGMMLLGFITCGHEGFKIPSAKVIGHIKDLESILKKEVIDEVFIALTEKETDDKEEIFRICENIGVDTYLVPATYEWQLAKSVPTTIGKLNLIRFFTVPINPYLLGIKRAIDMTVSSLFLILFPFLYALIGLLIKLDSPGPVLYRQWRVAHNRRKFYCYKFRTMLNDADKRVDLLDALDETEGPIRKAKNDPRVTRVGKLLRRFSIDEIPQFINVFKGEMSLVGPRPPTPDEVEQYKFKQLRTGLWQVSGRDAIKSFEERLQIDLYYIDHWSLWMDLKIILKTIFIIFKGAA